MPNNQIKSLTVDGVTYDIVDETSGYMKGMTILSYGNSTWQDFLTAYNEQKVVYCRASSQSNPASGEQTRLAFMAYVNDADTPTEVEFQYYRSVNTHTEAQQGDQVFVYKLTSAGNWTVTTREASVKVAVGGDLTGSYSNGVYTVSGDIPNIEVEPKVTTGVNIADITVDATTYELYAPTGGGGSVESVGVSNATNGGLSVSGSPITSSGTITIGHSNVLTSAQTTQAVYPIKIDKNGHISEYGSAVSIPTKVSDLTNDSGYITGYTETDPTVPSWAKASDKPEYYANEIEVEAPVDDDYDNVQEALVGLINGKANTSHAHGNITSGGDITATAPTVANGDQIVINDSSASKITNGPTFDGSTTNKYLSPKGTWESLPQGTAYTAGTGLSLSGTEFNHSNSVTAQTTQAVYPIEIDAQGHISAYGSAVNIDNFVKNYYGENISGYIATTTSDGYGMIGYRDLSFNEDNTALIQYGTTSHNTSSFISLSADDINIGGNLSAENNKIINLGTPTASTDAATKDYVDSNIPSSAASSTTGVSISDHSTGSVTGVQSSVTTASKVTLGLAISVPNVTAVGSGSFTQGSFNGGSLTFAIDSTDDKQLNITFTAATHGADSHTHTAPTLGTAKSIPNVTGVSDVTVPIKNTSATTVVTSATHTVTDNGHTHNLS